MKHLMCKLRGYWSHEEICEKTEVKILESVKRDSALVALLPEGFLSIRSFPEDGFVLVDYFSCVEDPGVENFQGLLRRYYDVEESVVIFR